MNIADSDNASEVLRIARQHKHNHAFYDDFLDKKKTKKLFCEEAMGFLHNKERKIYVLKSKDGKVLGFISYLEPILFNKALNKKVITVDFIAVDKRSQNKNLGAHLLASTLAMMSDFEIAELRVASDNYPALNFYTKFGFRIIGGDVWLSYQPR